MITLEHALVIGGVIVLVALFLGIVVTVAAVIGRLIVLGRALLEMWFGD